MSTWFTSDTTWLAPDEHWLTGLALRMPVKAKVERDIDGTWIASEERTLQFGVGDTFAEAVHDLRRALVEYRDVLVREETRLAPRLRMHLAYLNRVLKP